MQTFGKLAIGALACALAAVTIRRQNADLAMLLGVAGCCLGGLLLLELADPLLSCVRELYAKTGLDASLLSPLLRSAGVALLTQISSAVCVDAGQTALAKLIETGGAVLCLVLSLPLLRAVLEMIGNLAGG